MCYKIFTTRFGQDTETNLDKLRKEFPKHKFIKGVYKDSKGIFVLIDTENRQYGEKWETPNGDVFFSPTPQNISKIIDELPKYKTEWESRIKIKLLNGKELEIFPAVAIPKKVYFTRRIKAETDETFNLGVDYGKAAYELYDLTQKEEKLMLDDPRMINFVKLALKWSYTLPEPMWDSLDIISFGDFDRIFAAAMGCDWDNMQEELKKSNSQLQQTTGTVAS